MRRTGFTLTELTAVAAILSAVSLGTYQAVRKGKQVECLNNLRQIYQAIQMCAQDTDTLPNARFFPQSAADFRGIHNLLKRYGVNVENFYCPSVPDELNVYGTNYIWNDALSNRHSASASSSTWMMTEMTSVSSKVPPPHGNQYNILYGDGSVRLGSRVDMPEPQLQPSAAKDIKREPDVEVARPGPAQKSVQLMVLAPTEVKSGQRITVQVRFVDEKGNSVPAQTGTLAVRSSDVRASLPATVNVTGGDRFDFEAALVTAGRQWITVRHEQQNLEKAVEITVTGSGVEKFAVHGMPASFRAGQPADIRLTALDQFGNKTAYAGKLLLFHSAGPVSPPQISVENGEWQGQIVLTRASQQGELLFTDGAGVRFTEIVSVKAADPARIVLTLQKTDVNAGTPVSLDITVADRYENPCDGFEGELTFSTSSTVQDAPGSVALRAGDRGRKTIQLTLLSAGAQKIRLESGDIATEADVVVNPGLLDHFSVDTIRDQVAGEPFRILVKAQDRWNNRVKGFYLTDRSQSARYVQQDFSSGTWMEEVVITRAGADNYIEISDGMGHVGRSNTFLVRPAEASVISLEGLPDRLTPGEEYRFQAVVRDRFGNTVGDYAGKLDFSSSDSRAVFNISEKTGFPLDVSVRMSDAGRHFLEAVDKTRPSLKARRDIQVIPR